MKNEQFVPAALKGRITVQDAINRYDASISWIEKHGHAIISNGPFYLDNFNVAGGTVTINAFRDPSYPFEVGHWVHYETPRVADISSIDVPRIVTIGQPTSMKVNVTIAGQPRQQCHCELFCFKQGWNGGNQRRSPGWKQRGIQYWTVTRHDCKAIYWTQPSQDICN